MSDLNEIAEELRARERGEKPVYSGFVGLGESNGSSTIPYDIFLQDEGGVRIAYKLLDGTQVEIQIEGERRFALVQPPSPSPFQENTIIGVLHKIVEKYLDETRRNPFQRSARQRLEGVIRTKE